MALAMIYPEPGRGRGKKDAARKESESGSFSYTRVKHARSVLGHSQDLAQAVVKGSLSLDDALGQVEEAVVSAPTVLAQRADRAFRALVNE